MARRKKDQDSEDEAEVSADAPDAEVAAAEAETDEADEAEEEEEEEAADDEAAEEEDASPDEPKKAKKKAKKKGGRRKKAGTPDGFSAFVAKVQGTNWSKSTVLASDTPYRKLPRISTGNLGLDVATYGGWPRGRISKVFGREKSAKTGTLLNTVAQWQKHCGQCYERFACQPDCQFSGREAERPKAAALWIDAENRLESMWDWVEAHGIDLSRLLVMSPPDGQHIIDFVEAVIYERGAGIGLIVIDSVAHITSKEEIDKPTMKGKTAPVNALLFNRGLRKWTSAVQSLGVKETRKPTILLINQIRLTLDQYHPETQPGGEGHKYASSIDVRFVSGKYHYWVQAEDGSYEDKVQAFKSQWKPGEDDRPDYVEINYRVMNTGICPTGRYGMFHYWLRKKHGRRVGDPDNGERMWDYVKKLDLLKREGRNYTLFGLEAPTQLGVKDQFLGNTEVQAKVWALIVQHYIDDEHSQPEAATATEVVPEGEAF